MGRSSPDFFCFLFPPSLSPLALLRFRSRRGPVPSVAREEHGAAAVGFEAVTHIQVADGLVPVLDDCGRAHDEQLQVLGDVCRRGADGLGRLHHPDVQGTRQPAALYQVGHEGGGQRRDAVPLQHEEAPCPGRSSSRSLLETSYPQTEDKVSVSGSKAQGSGLQVSASAARSVSMRAKSKSVGAR